MVKGLVERFRLWLANWLMGDAFFASTQVLEGHDEGILQNAKSIASNAGDIKTLKNNIDGLSKGLSDLQGRVICIDNRTELYTGVDLGFKDKSVMVVTNGNKYMEILEFPRGTNWADVQRIMEDLHRKYGIREWVNDTPSRMPSFLNKIR